ncbi:MAG: hypothetical protein DLM54_01365 [Acidimicrobiales bacterium]|nr:MAG: hypothetical protein DLM54_01365 [Acidimicrobiales bacterium]
MDLFNHRAHQAAHDLATWQAVDTELRHYLEEIDQNLPSDQPEGIVLAPGEQLVLDASPIGLMEPHRARGTYEGGYAGVSLGSIGGIRPRIGATRGHYVQGPEVQQVMDTGRVVVTTERIVFTGPLHAMTWPLAKLLGVNPAQGAPATTLLPVQGREKVDALVADNASADELRFRIKLAQAHHQGAAAVAAYKAELTDELTRHQTTKPTASA